MDKTRKGLNTESRTPPKLTSSTSRVYGKAQVASSDTGLDELALVITLLCLSWIMFLPWPMVSAIAALAALAMLVCGTVYRYCKRKEHAKLLKDPFEVHFLIPKETEYKVDYYSQDSNEHHLDTLELPFNSEHDVMIWMKARLDVTISELQFGCIGDLESKPEPLYYHLPWVKEGIRKVRYPEKDEDHYEDYTNIYHIICHGMARPKDDILLSGLKMRTKARGTFDFWVSVVMPEKSAEKTLKIKVV